MLKPHLPKSHSSKKAKQPIEITLRKKDKDASKGQEVRRQEASENSIISYQMNKNREETIKLYSTKQGLSGSRPLSEKHSNVQHGNSGRHLNKLIRFNEQKLLEEKLKLQIFPEYKLDWSTHLQQQKRPSQQFIKEKQLVVNVENTKKQGIQNGDIQQGNVLEDSTHQTKSRTIVNDSNGIGSVRSKIRGIAKGFLRDNMGSNNGTRNQYDRKERQTNYQLNNANDVIDEQTNKQQQQTTLLIKESLNHKTIRPIKLPIPSAIPKSNHQPQIETHINLTSQYFPTADSNLAAKSSTIEQLLQQKLHQTNQLKMQYKELETRLQKCIDQIEVLQKTNSTERIVQLENQLAIARDQHSKEKEILLKKMEELQLSLKSKGLECQERQKETIKLREKVESQKTQKTVDSQVQTASVSMFQNDKCLKKSVTRQVQTQDPQFTQNPYQTTQHLTQSRLSSSQNSNITHRPFAESHQSSIYELDIMKKKYNTLEQILESKKAEISNKDQIIMMLMRNKVNQAIGNGDCKNTKAEQILTEIWRLLQINISQS